MNEPTRVLGMNKEPTRVLSMNKKPTRDVLGFFKKRLIYLYLYCETRMTFSDDFVCYNINPLFRARPPQTPPYTNFK